MPEWTWTLAALSLGLAMDATAVAAARGLVTRSSRLREGITIALTFGAFQAAMALAGWALGSALGRWIREWDHWIAFALLALIGGKMLHEAWTFEGEADGNALSFTTLVGLALATSIDAFAAGVTLPTIGAPVVIAIIAIGVTTTVLSGAGFAGGGKLGELFGKRLDAFGGVVLIALAVKVLVQDLSFG